MFIYFLAIAKKTKNLFGQMNKHLSRRVLFIWIACGMRKGNGVRLCNGTALYPDNISDSGIAEITG